ncbi:beta-mannosidase [Kalaharituber pfeilii]|nr:beta-mannosidase [Kalaharituber pfeilii]
MASAVPKTPKTNTTEVTGKRTSTPLVAGWTFYGKGPGGEKEAFPVAQFPTNIHLDLLAYGFIPDPFLGKNELAVQWVGEEAWIYRTTFATPKLSGEPGEKIVLAFDGLDTYATVVLNGKEILKTENMFIPERVDVTGVVEKEGGRIAYLKGKKIEEEYPNHHWGCWNGDRSRLAVRKAQYHYGWDWGPTLLTCGPWRPISLETYVSRISDLYFHTEVPESLTTATIAAHAEIDHPSPNAQVRFELSLAGDDGAKVFAEAYATANEAGVASYTFTQEGLKLWYPHGYGEQPLYTITATLVEGGESGNPVVLDKASKRFGVRRARVVQRPLKDQPGTTFFFEINNMPIFCGGGNWIPADNFIPRIEEERYRNWLKLMVAGNQTMVRVWGGGIYEEEVFYNTCDELGLLVWQDFLFGCGNYPAFPSLLESIKREATANVKRLRHHPSIVIFAGNNEDYQYMESENLEYDPSNNDPESWLKTSFPARYIYEKILVDVTKELVPNTYYHFGSPYGGKDTRDPTVGDIHQWNVWHGTQEKYQNFDKLAGRFVSEFGMEAFPDLRTLEGYLPRGAADPDRYAQSSTVDFHNKADGHERRIALYMVENMRYGPQPLEQYIYSTQLMQSECLSSAYRLWRREWKGPGREYCAGALVWQMNDCWPVTSWAIVDYYLRPKMAYYTIARELAPLSLGVKRVEIETPRNKYTRVHINRTFKLQIWVSSFLMRPVEGAKVVVRAFEATSGKEVFSGTLKDGITVEANRTTELLEILLPGVNSENLALLDPGAHDAVRRIVHAVYLVSESGEQLTRRVSWPEPLKYVHLARPKRLVVDVDAEKGEVRAKAEVPVKGLAFGIKGGKGADVVWGDNLVDVVPGEEVVVKVRGLKKGEEGLVGWRYLGYE